MVWKKTTSNYVGDWHVFNISGRSLLQIAKVSFVVGLIWGIGVCKIYGLPGDKHRQYLKEMEDLKKLGGKVWQIK